jgi:hypothetical protein
MTNGNNSTDTIAGGSSVLVLYGNQPAALVSVRRFSFLGEVRNLSPGDPLVRVVAHMAYYAQLVLAGELPGPYRDGDAERFARFALIDPDELRDRCDASDAELAARFRVPIEQIRAARTEEDGADAG